MIALRRRSFVHAAKAIVAKGASAHEAFRKTKFFTALNGLRAASILAVVWHHTGAHAAPANWTILHEGNHGVDLFFVISAFLISTLLIRAKRGNTLHVPRFWARRALRTLPLYYAVLTLYVVAVFAIERDTAAGVTFFENLPAFATLTSNWFVALDGDSERVLFYFAWSLAAEEQFYLCWPWVERFASRIGALAIALAALVVTQIAGLFYASGMTHFGLKIAASVPAGILVGVVLAHLLDSRRAFAWLHAFVGRRGSASLAALVVIAVLWVAPHFGNFRSLAVALAFGLLVCTCVAREDNDLAWLLRLKLVAWVGTVSFGIYLLHKLAAHAFHLAFEAAFHTSSAWADFAGGAIVGVIVATLSYRVFESFFLARKERWFGDSSRPLIAPGAPAIASVRVP